MKVFRIIGRSITSSLRSVFRNFSLSMASITCTMITLILVAIGILLTHNLNHVSQNLENEVTIVIFMDLDITKEQLEETESLLKTLPNVEEVVFRSAEERREIAMRDEQMARILEALGDELNPLSHSFVIQVEDIRDIRETATTISNMEYVDQVNYGENIANDLVRMLGVVQTSANVLVIALIIVTTFLIGNTIKITIFSRRNEIEIMRLVGTSNTVIKLPFFFEGLILGALGAVIPILITIFGYDYLYQLAYRSPNLSNIMGVLSLISPSEVVISTSLILLAIGSAVGMIGSVRAVKRYLKI